MNNNVWHFKFNCEQSGEEANESRDSVYSPLPLESLHHGTDPEERKLTRQCSSPAVDTTKAAVHVSITLVAYVHNPNTMEESHLGHFGPAISNGCVQLAVLVGLLDSPESETDGSSGSKDIAKSF